MPLLLYSGRQCAIFPSLACVVSFRSTNEVTLHPRGRAGPVRPVLPPASRNELPPPTSEAVPLLAVQASDGPPAERRAAPPRLHLLRHQQQGAAGGGGRTAAGHSGLAGRGLLNRRLAEALP